MMNSNLAFKVETALGYPFVAYFFFITVYTLYPLAMLFTFADGREEGTDYYELKNAFIERYGTPKKFFNYTWQICKDRTRECNQEMKESWPILLAMLISSLLPFVVSLILGWC